MRAARIGIAAGVCICLVRVRRIHPDDTPRRLLSLWRISPGLPPRPKA